MTIVRALGSLSAAAVLVLAPTAAHAADDTYGEVAGVETSVGDGTASDASPASGAAALPNTGMGDSTLVLGGAGLALLAGGAIVVTRRRQES